jgi:hypothetical protein
MINLIPTKTDDLRVLLERLFPDSCISDTGVALLAAEITDLENRREAMQSRIDVNRESRLVKRESFGLREKCLERAAE